MTDPEVPEIKWPKPLLVSRRWRGPVRWDFGVDWSGAGRTWTSAGMQLWNRSGSYVWLRSQELEHDPMAAAAFSPMGQAAATAEGPRRGRPFVPSRTWLDAEPVADRKPSRSGPAQEHRRGWRRDLDWELPSSADGPPVRARKASFTPTDRTVDAPLRSPGRTFARPAETQAEGPAAAPPVQSAQTQRTRPPAPKTPPRRRASATRAEPPSLVRGSTRSAVAPGDGLGRRSAQLRRASRPRQLSTPPAPAVTQARLRTPDLASRPAAASSSSRASARRLQSPSGRVDTAPRLAKPQVFVDLRSADTDSAGPTAAPAPGERPRTPPRRRDAARKTDKAPGRRTEPARRSAPRRGRDSRRPEARPSARPTRTPSVRRAPVRPAPRAATVRSPREVRVKPPRPSSLAASPRVAKRLSRAEAPPRRGRSSPLTESSPARASAPGEARRTAARPGGLRRPDAPPTSPRAAPARVDSKRRSGGARRLVPSPRPQAPKRMVRLEEGRRAAEAVDPAGSQRVATPQRPALARRQGGNLGTSPQTSAAARRARAPLTWTRGGHSSDRGAAAPRPSPLRPAARVMLDAPVEEAGRPAGAPEGLRAAERPAARASSRSATTRRSPSAKRPTAPRRGQSESPRRVSAPAGPRASRPGRVSADPRKVTPERRSVLRRATTRIAPERAGRERSGLDPAPPPLRRPVQRTLVPMAEERQASPRRADGRVPGSEPTARTRGPRTPRPAPRPKPGRPPPKPRSAALVRATPRAATSRPREAPRFSTARVDAPRLSPARGRAGSRPARAGRAATNRPSVRPTSPMRRASLAPPARPPARPPAQPRNRSVRPGGGTASPMARPSVQRRELRGPRARATGVAEGPQAARRGVLRAPALSARPILRDAAGERVVPSMGRPPAVTLRLPDGAPQAEVGGERAAMEPGAQARRSAERRVPRDPRGDQRKSRRSEPARRRSTVAESPRPRRSTRPAKAAERTSRLRAPSSPSEVPPRAPRSRRTPSAVQRFQRPAARLAAPSASPAATSTRRNVTGRPASPTRAPVRPKGGGGLRAAGAISGARAVQLRDARPGLSRAASRVFLDAPVQSEVEADRVPSATPRTAEARRRDTTRRQDATASRSAATQRRATSSSSRTAAPRSRTASPTRRTASRRGSLRPPTSPSQARTVASPARRTVSRRSMLSSPTSARTSSLRGGDPTARRSANRRDAPPTSPRGRLAAAPPARLRQGASVLRRAGPGTPQTFQARAQTTLLDLPSAPETGWSDGEQAQASPRSPRARAPRSPSAAATQERGARRGPKAVSPSPSGRASRRQDARPPSVGLRRDGPRWADGADASVRARTPSLAAPATLLDLPAVDDAGATGAQGSRTGAPRAASARSQTRAPAARQSGRATTLRRPTRSGVSWPQHEARVRTGEAVGSRAASSTLSSVQMRTLEAPIGAESFADAPDEGTQAPSAREPRARAPRQEPAARRTHRPQAPPMREPAQVALELPRTMEEQRQVRAEEAAFERGVKEERAKAKVKTRPRPARKVRPPATKARIPEPPPIFEWEAPQAPAPERATSAPARARASKQVGPAPRVSQSEAQVYQVLKSLVRKSPESRRLIKDIHKEIEALRRLERLRKL